MTEAVGPLAPGQRLSLTGSALPANLDNSGSSGQQLVRVSKTNQAGYDVIPLDVAKVTGNPDLPGTSRAPLGATCKSFEVDHSTARMHAQLTSATVRRRRSSIVL